jgi:hypothetical protein
VKALVSTEAHGGRPPPCVQSVMNLAGVALLALAASSPSQEARGFLTSRTAVLRVELEPEHDYWIGINTGVGGFRSSTGVAAASAAIEFRSGPARR